MKSKYTFEVQSEFGLIEAIVYASNELNAWNKIKSLVQNKVITSLSTDPLAMAELKKVEEIIND